MTRILAFDCSSTTLAYAILEIDTILNISYVSSGYLKPSKEGSITQRLATTRDALQKIIKKENPDVIVIEDIIQFMKQKSNAQAIITLAVFNRMLCLLSNDFLKKEPTLLAVPTIRAVIRRAAKLDKAPSKEEIPSHLENIIPLFKFPWEFKVRNTDKPKEECYDVSDAIACGVAYWYQQVEKENKKNKTSKKKK